MNKLSKNQVMSKLVPLIKLRVEADIVSKQGEFVAVLLAIGTHNKTSYVVVAPV